MSAPLHVVILAAGRGRRMRSARPKVLHRLGGEPLLAHVLRAAAPLGGRIHVVHGHGGEAVRAAFDGAEVAWVHQREQLGTGHAVAQALPAVPDEARVLVLCGDVPLIGTATLRALLEAAADGVGVLTVELADPTGYGRIVRDAAGRVRAIVEERDADEAVRALREVNTGILTAPASPLRRWLGALSRDNAQGEYYLTDIVGLAVAEGVPVTALPCADPWEVAGVNDRAQLAALERVLQRRRAAALMAAGASLADPARVEIRGEVTVGRDVEIDVGVVLEGRVVLGEGARVGPFCVLRDTEVGPGAVVEAFCHLEGARIGAEARVGPYARLRPGAELAEAVHVGNFVEVKNARLGRASKANHLAYLGDAEIGARVNIGAGTITCNYDGARKHRTVIEDEAFIGSDTQLVAPVRVGRGATVGAGSTITRDVPPGGLTLSRVPQQTVPHWQRPRKDRDPGERG
ncbi:bifunctional UDP-N-acetylglucosamine diphosphorylase/glucosamine-1-phosphate N-acetyltransferase GlmU [Inmirania thermothiophila]|uniref:Bifunctional protein GlmU n=1 Tax=Inmirania thermothiophila TaxID=1750597 RepID=A0A3N1Y683_9GAMM|nr:bifunctional UDP-N-acetylglucosamine diphosphorylase/glucosamine-1-phosphate N-acetyltransferase GlmU [Inmirania thermothiophila]ROR34326.1 UDP-N-acetylglucosamine pyrophosphorylase /glucosamine-1-phosphate N-acetyltransferase [Inmirania thermothiophila]